MQSILGLIFFLTISTLSNKCECEEEHDIKGAEQLKFNNLSRKEEEKKQSIFFRPYLSRLTAAQQRKCQAGEQESRRAREC